MHLKFKAAIEQHYQLKIKSCTYAPRQFVADTFFLEDTQGNNFFCKLIDKPLFIPGIIQSLAVVEEMHAQGIQRICYPIRGAHGLHIFFEDTLIVLFNFIPATQSVDYNLYALGKLIAEIHAITPQITATAPQEDFVFPQRILLAEQLNEVLTSNSTDPVFLELKNLLQTYEEELHNDIEELFRLGKICKATPGQLVITHGDASTNVLVKSKDDIYLIDWDELRLAPAERDLWRSDEHPQFLQGYRSVRPEFIGNPELRSFCILQYHFERLMHYLVEILNPVTDIEYRRKCLQKLAQGRLGGWRLPKLEEVRNARYD